MTGMAPAGWYPDGSGALRWFDGASWTEHIAAVPPPLTRPAPAPVLPEGAPAARSAYDAVALSSWSDPSSRVAPASSAAPLATSAPPRPTPTVTTTYAPALPASLAPAAPAQSAIGGWLLVAGGLVLLLFGLRAFLDATAHGYVSTGGLVSGSILTVRGIMRLRASRWSGTVVLPRMPVLSPLRIGVLAVVAILVAAAAMFALRATSGPGPLLDVPGVPAAAGEWPSGYTAVGLDGAYRRTETSIYPCQAGFRCSGIEVLTRTVCAHPQLEVSFFGTDGRPTGQIVGIGIPGGSPDSPTPSFVSTADPAAARFAVDAITCND